MIDIGVNLTSSRFDKDREQVIERAKSAGVSTLVLTGTNVAESQKALEICQQYGSNLYATAGVHPHDADNVEEDYIERLTQLAQYKQVKAIGECGLDFNRNFSTPDNQRRVFSQQIALAEQLKMPLFLHQRDAFNDWFGLLEPYLNSVPAMISHCFTGDTDELKQCVEAGMYIGITGWICDERRGQALRAAVKHLPLERLMIETDAPYLTPRTIRPRPKSSRNEPGYLPYVVDTLAELMQCPVDTIAEYSRANSEKVFGLV